MRLPLIPPDKLPADLKPTYDDMRSGIEKNFKGFKAIDESGALIGPWNPWLQFPAGKPIWELTKALSFNPTLPRPVREIAILVTGAHYHSAYELYAHVIAGESRGLPDDTLATIVAGQRPAGLTHDQGVAYDVAYALNQGGVLPELNYRQAVQAFTQTGAAELIYLVGLYSLVSITLNGFDVPVPEDHPGAAKP
jgi:alkylhydroperoxidase family enzyme